MSEENSNPSTDLKSSPEPQAPSARSLNGLSALIALSTVLIAAYSAWQGYESSHQLQTKLAIADEALQLAETNNTNLNQSQQQIARLRTALNALNQQNNSNQVMLSQTADWIRAAQMSQLLNNTDNAIQYLQLADQTILSLNNPQFQDTHNAINQDISNLKTKATTNQEALIIKLDNLSQSILQLPTVFSANKANPSKTASTFNPYETRNWKQKLRQTLAYLKGFVVIKHNTELPILTPQQQDLLRMSLAFKVMQTEWAVMQFNDAVYQHNLALIAELMQAYFVRSSATTATLEQIKELQQIHLANNSMLINNSLNAVMSHFKGLNLSSNASNTASSTGTQPPASNPSPTPSEPSSNPARPSLRDSVEA